MQAILTALAAASQFVLPDRVRMRRDAPEPCILDAIGSPLTAAAVMLVAIAKLAGPISDLTANTISDELKSLSGSDDVTELLVFSGWASEIERDAHSIVKRFAGLWLSQLTQDERSRFVEAARRVAASTGAADPAQCAAMEQLSATFA